MGLDPPTVTNLSQSLYSLAKRNLPRMVLALRPQDPLPDWISHIVYLGPKLRIASQGPRKEVADYLRKQVKNANARDHQDVVHPSILSLEQIGHFIEGGETLAMEAERKAVMGGFSNQEKLYQNKPSSRTGNNVIEMEAVLVEYGGRKVFDWKQSSAGKSKAGLWWTVKEGERWALFGPNGMWTQMCSPVLTTAALSRNRTHLLQDLAKRPYSP